LEWLIRANITPIDYFWIDNKKGNFQFKASKLSYSYNYYWYLEVLLRKIYQPNSLDSKWFSNVNATIIQNYKNLPKTGENLIVSSSYKDTGAIECNANIPSVAPNTESAFLPEKVIPKLNERFKNKYVFFDQDAGGHNGAKRYEQKYGWKPIFIPEWCGVKDPSDFVKKYGQYEFIQMLKSII